ncbi:disulfide-isomerase ER-60 [Histomonas meleagridis]|uniref:disulfide-isomerase ER-60 n=1 Tax=Histomonas meleagridis TaxID=135588 RepID=UPI00355A76CA|nr:disulfide-isomerase ER-60 [Histomonas meleagridis]KAH0797390.1 disulfide-isomerase ER-60 [Histomonas meleagridis]
MFLLFSTLVSSIYVPFSSTSKPITKVIKKSEIDNYTYGTAHLFVLGLEAGDKLTNVYHEHIHDMAMLFGGQAKFAIFESQYAERFADKHKTHLPFIAYYYHGIYMATYIYPPTESALLYLFDYIINDDNHTEAKSLKELNTLMGPYLFTILTTKENIQDAEFIRNEAGRRLGPVHIVPVTTELIHSFGIDDKVLGFFRKDDMNIVSIEPKLRDIFRATFPKYRILKASDLQKPKKLVLALIDQKISSKYRDFLFEMGSRFPNITVGFAGQNVKSMIERCTNEGYDDIHPGIALFNLDQNIHYNTTEFFHDLIGKPFFTEKWLSAATLMIGKVLSGEIQPSYVSEDVPPKSDFNVQKLVGLTYGEYVDDPENDVVVIYKRENCEHCKEFFPKFLDFARECEKANVQNLKFGFIDVVKNSAKKPFPYMMGVPHVRIFPAKNKTNDQPMRGGNDRGSLIRLINRYGLHKLPFEEPPLDKATLAAEMMQLLMSQDQAPPDEQMKNLKFMEEMAPLLEEKSKEIDEEEEKAEL